MSQYYNHVLGYWCEEPSDNHGADQPPAHKRPARTEAPGGITVWVRGALASLAYELAERLRLGTGAGGMLCLNPWQENAGTPMVEMRQAVERAADVPAGLPMAYQVDPIPPALWARLEQTGGVGASLPGALPFLIVATPIAPDENEG